MEINNIKELVIDEEELKNSYLTIESADKKILYNDLPENASKFKTFSEFCSAGKIKISIHIPNYVFYKNMKSFYPFMAIYIMVCVALLISVNIIGTKHITKPIMNIINILEQSRNLKSGGVSTTQKNSPEGFDYISSIIINADKNIESYQDALNTQQRIIQARLFERAVNGQLVSKNDIQNFDSFFPKFPTDFRLILIRFWIYSDKRFNSDYNEPLLLVQSFLQTELKSSYQQQINDTELLILLSKNSYEESKETFNFLVSNINNEEPTYHICCMASDIYNRVEDLSTAYQQLRTLDEMSFDDYQNHICTVSDSLKDFKASISMNDVMTLYTAITSGNLELALNRLSTISNDLLREENISFTKPIYEIIKSMLSYIRINYSQVLMEHHIPSFKQGIEIYEQLSETVESFCTLIGDYTNINKDSFTQDLISYIDTHYTDPDICVTSLKSMFKCSESTIRKEFKQITDVPIAKYIEQKRMILANQLLLENKKSVAEVALECGYTLPHSFYKAYKRVYGHAPTVQNN